MSYPHLLKVFLIIPFFLPSCSSSSLFGYSARRYTRVGIKVRRSVTENVFFNPARHAYFVGDVPYRHYPPGTWSRIFAKEDFLKSHGVIPKRYSTERLSRQNPLCPPGIWHCRIAPDDKRNEGIAKKYETLASIEGILQLFKGTKLSRRKKLCPPGNWNCRVTQAYENGHVSQRKYKPTYKKNRIQSQLLKNMRFIRQNPLCPPGIWHCRIAPRDSAIQKLHKKLRVTRKINKEGQVAKNNVAQLQSPTHNENPRTVQQDKKARVTKNTVPTDKQKVKNVRVTRQNNKCPPGIWHCRLAPDLKMDKLKDTGKLVKKDRVTRQNKLCPPGIWHCRVAPKEVDDTEEQTKS